MTNTNHSRNYRIQRGITLVEALVAFLVMAMGMLAAVGTQMTLRLNSDVAKQRSEAVRIAQNDLDTNRTFITLPTTNGMRAFADITTTAAPTVLAPANTNAEFVFVRDVADAPNLLYRTVSAEITWQDRQGTSHPVRLDTIIAGISPALSGYLSLTSNGNPTGFSSRTNSKLPIWVRDLQDGRSVFKPIGSGTIAWIFNNQTGLIISRCVVPAASDTETLTTSDLSACLDPTITPLAGRLVAGYVRFSSQSPPDPVTPIGLAFEMHPTISFTGTGATPTYECFDNSATAANIAVRIQYYCAVFVASPTTAWSGYLTMGPPDLWRAQGAAYRLCRYSSDFNLSGTIDNNEHPLDYAMVQTNLLNQNFLVLASTELCPTSTLANTQQHDPRPTP